WTTFLLISSVREDLPASGWAVSIDVESSVSVNVRVKNGYDEVNIQISAKTSVCLSETIMLGKKNVTTHDLEIKPCSSLGWIKHKLSQDNGNISKPATDRFEYDDRNTDKPSSFTTQRPNMHTARSLRSDRACIPLGHYKATERSSRSRPGSSQVWSLHSDQASVPFGRYVATELFRNAEYDTNPCVLVYSLMLSPDDCSKPISCFSIFEVINRTL
ncbi:hypothetical protein IGI04_030407, partial [Brassica rapa subsp. trilocularis]